MENKIKSISLNLFLILSLILIFNFSDVFAHKKKNHKEMICIPEEERTEGVKNRCKALLFIHRLCIEEQHCQILKLEAQQITLGINTYFMVIIQKGEELLEQIIFMEQILIIN